MEQITEQGVRQFLTGTFGQELNLYEELGSTNDTAKLLAKNGAPHGAVIVARRQTAGKGRLGRSFYSPADSGIYMTAILRPQGTAEQSLLITSAAAVAVSRAIARVAQVQVKIKWVNDLYKDGKKLCGILAEAGLRAGGGVDYIVVGIGVNITENAFPPEVREIATALVHADADTIDRNRLIAEIINELETVWNQLDTREFLTEYRERSCVIGRGVRMIRGDVVELAQVRDIDENAHLLVRMEETGEERVISTGEVSLRGDFT